MPHFKEIYKNLRNLQCKLLRPPPPFVTGLAASKLETPAGKSSVEIKNFKRYGMRFMLFW